MPENDFRFDPVRGAVIHQPKNTRMCTEVWAWLSVDPSDQTEGVLARSFINPLGQTVLMPFIGADEANIRSFLPEVRRMKAISKNPIRLVKFTNREVVEEI